MCVCVGGCGCIYKINNLMYLMLMFQLFYQQGQYLGLCCELSLPSSHNRLLFFLLNIFYYV